MAKENKKGGFSVYWIYAILGVSLIAFQLYMSGDSQVSISDKKTLFSLIEAKGVRKIEIINEKSAEFYLSKEGVAYVNSMKGGDYE